MTDLVQRLEAVSSSEIETMHNLTREAAARIKQLERVLRDVAQTDLGSAKTLDEFETALMRAGIKRAREVI